MRLPPAKFPRVSTRVSACMLLLASAMAMAAGNGVLDHGMRDHGMRDHGVLDHSYRPLAGRQQVDLGLRYGGDVLLIVNTASKCGYTPQFDALESLHARYKAQGFSVLGFPSGDFREQEFQDEDKIREFCTLTYGVKFPMFQKVHVVGVDATPLYRDLKAATGEAPEWNFHKYLVGRDGRVLASFPSKTTPDDPAVILAIEQALKMPRAAMP